MSELYLVSGADIALLYDRVPGPTEFQPPKDEVEVQSEKITWESQHTPRNQLSYKKS